MVAIQALPGFATMNLLIFVILGLFTTVYASTPVKFCWAGADDNRIAFRNVSCITGESSLGNMISKKVQHSPTSSLVTDIPQGTSLNTNFRCVIFVYNESSITDNGVLLTFKKANYSCDSDELCLGKETYKSYKYTLNGYEGLLYCCNTENNCNTHALMNPPKHQHTCFHGDTDHMEADFQIMVCPHQENQCVRISTKHLRDGDSEVYKVRQQFHCDTMDMCKNDHQDKSCTTSQQRLNATTRQEVETCCCKKDKCFHPDWRPAAVNVQQTPEQSVLQRTLLIVIGVALGILVVGVAVFFILRSRRSRHQEHKPSVPGPHYSATVFRAISTNEDGINEEDKVQILPSTS